MAEIPAYMTPHRVTVEPLTGSGGMGETWGPPVSDVPAMVEEGALLVRDATGAETVSSARVHCSWDVDAPPGSNVTVWTGTAKERTATVVSTAGAPHPTLPSWQTLNLT
ncbi:hypothetical protein [Promicromonospora sp. NFX87]|uniref:hypothetical protein n=1 Tax=Promicromonospora sp. NFX87 TaxID=3402691 RepID=UPI003AFA9937